MLAKYGRWVRRSRLRRQGAMVGADLQSSDDFFSGHAAGFSCGRGAWIAEGARIMVSESSGEFGRLTIGDGLFMNHFAIIDCHTAIHIGNGVLIGPFAYICDFDHGITQQGGTVNRDAKTTSGVSIGNDVWIGAHSVILKGVSVGDRATIAAGAVVSRDVGTGDCVGGVPARSLRSRHELED